MNVLRVIHSLNPQAGGTVEALRLSAIAALPLGHTIEVVCLDPPDSDWLPMFPCQATGVGKANTGRYGYSESLEPWIIKNAMRFDAVIIDGIWQFHSYGTWKALRKSTIPYFVFTHGMLDPWFKRTYPLKHLKKWLYWPWADYRVLRDARAVLFTCKEEQELAAQSFWLHQWNSEIASLGVEAPPSSHKEDQILFRNKHFPNGSPYWLYLSRIHEKKGADILVQAYQKTLANCTTDVPDLIVAGPTGDQAFLEKVKALAAGSPKAHFLPMLTGSDKWGALSGADWMILPSHQENFGIVVAESLSVGTPVMISNKVNIWREITEASAGIAIDDTPQAIQSGIEQIQQSSDTSLTQYSEAATKLFQSRYLSSQATEALFNQIKKYL